MASRPLIRAAAAASVAAFLAAGPVGAAPPRASFVAPVRVEFPNGDDWEPAIAADAHGHVYVLATHYVGFAGGSAGDPDPTCPACGSPHMDLQVSSDGGGTFSSPRAPFPTSTRQDDPQLVVDPAGGRTLWASYMQDNKSSQYVARSDDFGLTWHTALVEPLRRGTDKDVLAVRGDDVYLVYHTLQKVFVSASHDGGQTWTTDNLLNGTTNSQLGQSLPSGGAVAPDGSVYFAWNGVTASGQAKGSINLYVTTSRDDGATWATTVVDVSKAAPDCGCGGWDYWGAQIALGVDASGRVNVLWNANRSKFAAQRMFFASSTDGARTFSAPRDISAAAAGVNHAFPALVSRASGDVRIAWADDRNGLDRGSDDPAARWNVYERESTDGGATWSPEAKLSAYTAGYAYKLATPSDGFLQPYGDYFEIDEAAGGRTVVAWGEGNSYAGPGNVWFVRQP